MLWFVFLLYSTLTRKNILAHRALLLAPTCQTSPLHGPQRTLLCPAMPQHALLFPSVPCYAPACPDMPQHDLLCPQRALLCPAMLQHARLCPSTPCCALLCCSVPCCALLCPNMPCCALLCPCSRAYGCYKSLTFTHLFTHHPVSVPNWIIQAPVYSNITVPHDTVSNFCLRTSFWNLGGRKLFGHLVLGVFFS